MGQAQQSLHEWLIVIPARLASTRLPNKPLQDLGGKPLIVRVYENLAPLKALGAEIIVATDAETVAQACQRHQIPCEQTSPAHQSGTDRCFEVANRHTRRLVLNVQGDEPCVDCKDLLALTRSLEDHPEAAIATLVFATNDTKRYRDPNVVKAVRNAAGLALYFSRSPLPYWRDAKATPEFWQHIGIYAFRADSLRQFCALKPSALEHIEKLEQLRALENGMPIYLQPAMTLSVGIDTPEDLEVARARF